MTTRRSPSAPAGTRPARLGLRDSLAAIGTISRAGRSVLEQLQIGVTRSRGGGELGSARCRQQASRGRPAFATRGKYGRNGQNAVSNIAAEVQGVLARYRETAIALSDDPAALAALSKAVFQAFA